MSKLKKNNGKGNLLHRLTTERRFRYGGFALLVTAIVLAVAVLVNVVLGIVEDNWALAIDLSPSRVTDFDEATYDTLEDVDKDIVLHLIFQDTTQTELRVQLEEMAKKYHSINGHITYDYIDPYTEPTKLSRYVDTSSVSLAEGSVIVSLADDTKSRYIIKSDLYNYSYVEDSTSSWGYSYQQAFNGEAKLTSAIKYVSSDDTPNVYFLAGHNEVSMDYCSYFVSYLEDENYSVQSLTLGGDTVPGAGDTIIITCPQADLTDDEYVTLSEWLQGGGRLLMSMDNSVSMSDLPNFASLLEIYQLSYGEGYVVEDGNATSNWTSSQSMITPVLNTEHEITSTLVENNKYLRTYLARPINNCDIPLSGVLYEVLLSTSDGAYVKPTDSATDMTDRTDAVAEGSQILAYCAYSSPDYQDTSKDTRIVLLSSPYFYADTNLITQSYNLDFSMACVEWLVNRDVSVYVRASQILNTTLEISDTSTVITIAVVSLMIPLLVSVAGVVVWVRRRRL